MRPLLWCQLAGGSHLQYACGAYQLIYRAELFGSPGDSLCDRIEVRDIYLHGMQLLCMVALQCLQGGNVKVEGDNPGALVQQFLRDGPAYPAAGTADNDALLGKFVPSVDAHNGFPASSGKNVLPLVAAACHTPN